MSPLRGAACADSHFTPHSEGHAGRLEDRMVAGIVAVIVW